MGIAQKLERVRPLGTQSPSADGAVFVPFDAHDLAVPRVDGKTAPHSAIRAKRVPPFGIAVTAMHVRRTRAPRFPVHIRPLSKTFPASSAGYDKGSEGGR